MSTRAKQLAERIEMGARALEAFASQMTEAQWNTPVLPDGRTAGVIVHHVASIYPVEIDLAKQIAAGQAVEGLTWGTVAELNAKHAAQNARPSRAEAIDLLQRNSREAADAVRTLSDEELDRAAAFSLEADAPLTAQFVIEDHAVRHSWHHLAKIRTAVGA